MVACYTKRREMFGSTQYKGKHAWTAEYLSKIIVQLLLNVTDYVYMQLKNKQNVSISSSKSIHVHVPTNSGLNLK